MVTTVLLLMRTTVTQQSGFQGDPLVVGAPLLVGRMYMGALQNTGFVTVRDGEELCNPDFCRIASQFCVLSQDTA